MRINEHYWLNSFNEPRVCRSFLPATPERYDSVAIYHKPDNFYFRPIVFTSCEVISVVNWELDTFYRGLRRCVEAIFSNVSSRKEVYPISPVVGILARWGCRRFTLEDICTMMEMMEYYYTDEQLGR